MVESNILQEKLNIDETWLSTLEVSKLLEKNEGSIRRNCRSGKYTTQQVVGNGGRQYRILLSSLPISAQAKYWRENCAEGAGAGVDSVDNEILSVYRKELDMKEYISSKDYEKKKAEKYLMLISKTDGMGKKEIEEFLLVWNKENPEFRSSYARIIAARKAYLENGISGILAGYGKNSGMSKLSEFDENLFLHFKSLYLKEGAPSLNSCVLQVFGLARKINHQLDVKEFPSAVTFLRKLEKEMPEQAIYLARHGQNAWNRKYAFYISRDYANLGACEAWVSDHAQIDVAVLGKDGKVYFPWVTAFRDLKTSLWVSWFVHVENPNSDHIFQSFYYGCEKYGAPSYVYLDNGKDYRCRDFAGGRKHYTLQIKEEKMITALSLLGIIPIFAKPYNAQSKTIERDFLKNKEFFSKHSVGYRGGNVTERPEILKTEIKKGQILKIADFKVIFDEFVNDVLNKMPSTGKVLQGRSPVEVWNEEYVEKKFISKESLVLFCMRTTRDLTIGRNGIRDSEFKITYWADWMVFYKGKKVYLRRDPQNYSSCYVFDSVSNEVLGMAYINGEVPVIAKDEVSKNELKMQLGIKNREKKILRDLVQAQDQVDIIDKVRNYKSALGSDIEAVSEPKVVKLQPTKFEEVMRIGKEPEVDLSVFVPERKEKKKIYLWEYEKQAMEG